MRGKKKKYRTDKDKCFCIKDGRYSMKSLKKWIFHKKIGVLSTAFVNLAKKGIEIHASFVYNVCIVAPILYKHLRPTVTEESKAFPKGD